MSITVHWLVLAHKYYSQVIMQCCLHKYCCLCAINCTAIAQTMVHLQLYSEFVKQSDFYTNKWSHRKCNFFPKGPSIYDVHTDRGRGIRLRWTHVDGGGEGPAHVDVHRKLKLESTDVILSSSHAKKLTSFLPEFRLWTEESGLFCDIN